MSVLCGACNTENRDAAKFCKGCGRKIAQAWPQAESPVVALAASGGASALLTGAGLAAPAPTPAVSPVPVAPPLAPSAAPEEPVDDFLPDFDAPRSKIGNGRWIAGVLTAVVLLVGAAGWYGLQNRSVPVTPEAATAATTTAASAAPPVVTPEVLAAPAPAAAPVPAEVPPAAPAVLSEKIELAPAAPEPAKPAAKPRQAAKKAPPPVAVAPEPPAPPPVVAAPAPVVVQTPQGQCGNRNFVAMAQCMADQCLKPEFRPHAQCEAVRRQQRLEEEKRNPSLVN